MIGSHSCRVTDVAPSVLPARRDHQTDLFLSSLHIVIGGSESPELSQDQACGIWRSRLVHLDDNFVT